MRYLPLGDHQLCAAAAPPDADEVGPFERDLEEEPQRLRLPR